jgi:hypothetical protein
MQAAVSSRIDEILDAIRAKDFDRLAANHLSILQVCGPEHAAKRER